MYLWAVMDFFWTIKELKKQLVSQILASVSLNHKLNIDQRTMLKYFTPKISFQEYMIVPKTLTRVGIT